MNTDNNLPRVTVVVPVYNAAQTIESCLESIRNLDYPNDKLELIVVDNCSTDGSDKIAKQFQFPFPARVLYETRKRASDATRNKGIEAARGEVIAFTNANCVAHPQWLRRLLEEFSDENTGCFAGEILGYKPTAIVERCLDQMGALRQIKAVTGRNLSFPYAQTGNAAYRKTVFDKIGLFLPIESGGDAEMSWRMQKRLGLKIKYAPTAIVYYRFRKNILKIYRQFKTYERGEIILDQYIQEFRAPTLEKRQDELRQHIRIIIGSLPRNICRKLFGKISAVDFCMPFIKAVIMSAMVAAQREMLYLRQFKKPPLLQIYLYPGEKWARNPYWTLLAYGIEKNTGAVIAFDDIRNLNKNALTPSVNDPPIIHLQWIDERYGYNGYKLLNRIKTTLQYAKVVRHFIFMSAMKKRRGAKVIWTVHDANRHNLRPFWTSLFNWWSKRISNAYIFHCRRSKNDFFMEASQKTSFVIPHGGYAGIYGPSVKNRLEAKRFLGVSEDAAVFLIMGAIRSSKNLEWLLNTLRRAAENTVFIIAGMPFTEKDIALQAQFADDGRFLFFSKFIRNEHMRWLLAGSDFLINAQNRGYTSGAVVTALSYGLPAIVLNWGCASLLVKHGVNGFLFHDEATLLNAITEAIEKIKKQSEYSAMRNSAAESMKRFEWNNIGKATASAYETILRGNASPL